MMPSLIGRDDGDSRGLQPVSSRDTRPPQQTLGKVLLRDPETDQIILIPAPSEDPNDPLNWPQWYKYFMAALICAAMMMCNFLAAGPTITIVSTTLDFFPEANPVTDPALFEGAVSKVAFFFTTTALLQGVGNFLWVPLANKYGRRPVYIGSYAIYLACAVWLVYEQSYAGFLTGRILMGFGAGAAETIAPITIADVFFLHERGRIMALYTAFLSVGVAFGMIVSGFITIDHHWRVIYQVAASLVGLILLLAFLVFPETAYPRRSNTAATATTANGGRSSPPLVRLRSASVDEGAPSVEKLELGTTEEGPPAAAARRGVVVPRRRGYLGSLRVFTGVKTDEGLARMFVRPFGLIFLPPVLWAALVQSVTIGFLVAVTSNVDVAFEDAYGFQPYQVGLCFVSAIVGSVLGIFGGGHLSDWTADRLTRRNGGVREPEMRLPAMMPCLVTTPLALILYGVGIGYRLHWMCPTVGLGLLNFSIAQGTNVCLVYVIDAYRPVAGEVTLAVMGFKSLFGFFLSFYTNPWVAHSGYMEAYGAMAGIAAIVILCWVPLYVWGKGIRHATWQWSLVSYIHWNEDREVGE